MAQRRAASGTRGPSGIGSRGGGTRARQVIDSKARERRAAAGSAVVGGGCRLWGSAFPSHPCLRAPLQLGPQAHVDDPASGQCPVPALSHHGCQVRGVTAAAGKTVWGGRRPLPPPPQTTPRRMSLPPSCSNLSWLGYGTLKGDGTLIVVNAVGAVLQTLYILVYLHYCPRKVEARPAPPPWAALPRWQDSASWKT